MKRVIVYGGQGGLGKALVSHFKEKGYWIVSVDLHENEAADRNVTVSLEHDWLQQEEHVARGIQEALEGNKVDGVVNAAGGWAGGNTKDKNWIKNADLMWKQSVWSSTLAADLASKHLQEGGVLVLPGARAALNGTPGMIGYGMAKAAVHQLVKSLGDPGSGLPEGACVLAMLPVTLDTPMNRKWMPKADTSTWTPLGDVVSAIDDWLQGKDRPSSGSLVSMITENHKTRCLVE